MFAISIQAESAKYDARMTGFAYSSEPGRAVYVPVDAWNAGDVRTLLGEYLGTGRISPAVHDAKAAIHALGNMGIGLPSVRLDTMIAAWLLDSNANVYNLDDLSLRLLGAVTTKYDEVVGKDADKRLLHFPVEAAESLLIDCLLEVRSQAQRPVNQAFCTAFRNCDRKILVSDHINIYHANAFSVFT